MYSIQMNSDDQCPSSEANSSSAMLRSKSYIVKPKGFITVINILVTRDVTSHGSANEYQFSREPAV
jgi:hypothetical protein